MELCWEHIIQVTRPHALCVHNATINYKIWENKDAICELHGFDEMQTS